MTLEALRRETEKGITWEKEKESQGPGETAQCVKCPMEQKTVQLPSIHAESCVL